MGLAQEEQRVFGNTIWAAQAKFLIAITGEFQREI